MHFLLLILSVVWCTLHSVLISISVLKGINKLLGNRSKFYRIIYNLLSVVTLVPIVILEARFTGHTYFAWQNHWIILRLILFIVAILLFYFGALHYNALEFLGIHQIRRGLSTKAISGNGEFNSFGIHNFVRHPWYLGALILIWLRVINEATLSVNLVFSLYLIVGAYLEERKLVIEFGKQYKIYQEEVSMWFPWKWLMRNVRKIG